MLIEKDELLVWLMEKYYKLFLEYGKQGTDDVQKSYLKGMLDTIEEVNKFSMSE